MKPFSWIVHLWWTGTLTGSIVLVMFSDTLLNIGIDRAYNLLYYWNSITVIVNIGGSTNALKNCCKISLVISCVSDMEGVSTILATSGTIIVTPIIANNELIILLIIILFNFDTYKPVWGQPLIDIILSDRYYNFYI